MMYTAKLENNKDKGIIEAKDMRIGDIAIIVGKCRYTNHIVTRLPFPNDPDKFLMIDLTSCNHYWTSNSCSIEVKVLPKGTKITIEVF